MGKKTAHQRLSERVARHYIKALLASDDPYYRAIGHVLQNNPIEFTPEEVEDYRLNPKLFDVLPKLPEPPERDKGKG